VSSQAIRGILTWLLVLWLLAATAAAVWMLVSAAPPWSTWAGLLLAGAPPLLYLVRTHVLRKTDSMPEPLGFSIICGLGVAISMAASWRFGPAAGSAHVAAGACLIGWVIYLRWLRH
jgi:hypothetical protein